MYRAFWTDAHKINWNRLGDDFATFADCAKAAKKARDAAGASPLWFGGIAIFRVEELHAEWPDSTVEPAAWFYSAGGRGGYTMDTFCLASPMTSEERKEFGPYGGTLQIGKNGRVYIKRFGD